MASQRKHKWVPIPGSERAPTQAVKPLGAGMEADTNPTLKVTVLLRRKPSRDPLAAMVEELGTLPPGKRKYLDQEKLKRRHGARADDIDKVRSHFQRLDLKVLEEHPGPRMLVLEGKLDAIQAAFGIRVDLGQSLETGDAASSPVRRRIPGEPLKIPAKLDGIVQGAFGIDDRPETRIWPVAQARMEVHAVPRMEVHGEVADPHRVTDPVEIARRYNFPEGDGKDQTIALIELGGVLDRRWVQSYLNKLHPSINWDVEDRVVEIHVDGAQSTAGANQEYDREVTLDVQVAAGVAPEAKILVYHAQNTSRGFITALAAAIHGNGEPPASISCSWGDGENTWTHQSMRAVDELLQDAAALGITVCCASGNDGSSDGHPGRNVDFPASSPHVLACGGTSRYRWPERGEGPLERGEEVAWTNLRYGLATGGGVSRVFPIPAWQADANVPLLDQSGRPCQFIGGGRGRGVPDLAGHADPTEGYAVGPRAAEFLGPIAKGTDLSKESLQEDWAVAGTSAVAPLMAGLVARINQQLGIRTGYLNPFLYRTDVRKKVFKDILGDSNGAFVASENWDACTGWGTVDGEELLKALKG